MSESIHYSTEYDLESNPGGGINSEDSRVRPSPCPSPSPYIAIEKTNRKKATAASPPPKKTAMTVKTDSKPNTRRLI